MSVTRGSWWIGALFSVGIVVGCSGEKSGESATEATSSGTATSTGAAAEACMLAPAAGSCDAAFERWAYDPASERCYSWIYGGCDGVVPFEGLEACQSACEPCEAFFADAKPTPSAAAVPIEIRNESGAAVWVQAFRGTNPLDFRAQVIEIAPAGGDPLLTAPNQCDFSCALYDNEVCGNACSDGGPMPAPIYVAPGGRFPSAWAGQHFPQVEVPARCWPKSCADGLSCRRWQNASFGDYEARAIVAAGLVCVEPGCSCTPNAEGWCAIESTGASLDGPTAIAAPLSWPGAEVLLVVGP